MAPPAGRHVTSSGVEIQLVEEHLIELPPYRVGRLAVQLLRIVEQVERRPDQRRPGFEQRPLCGQLGLDAGPLLANCHEPSAHLGRHRAARFHQVEQVLFLGVEIAQRLRQVLVHQLDAALLVASVAASTSRDPRREALRQPQRGVVPQHRRLGVLHAQVAARRMPGPAGRCRRSTSTRRRRPCARVRIRRDSMPRSWQRPHQSVLFK